MAGSVNKVILVGNLGRDPEVRYTQNNQKIVHLSVATSERWKDRQSGEPRERTEWHRVVIFNENLADIAERYLRKGNPVYLEGTLQTRKWTDQRRPGAVHDRGRGAALPWRAHASGRRARGWRDRDRIARGFRRHRLPLACPGLRPVRARAVGSEPRRARAADEHRGPARRRYPLLRTLGPSRPLRCSCPHPGGDVRALRRRGRENRPGRRSSSRLRPIPGDCASVLALARSHKMTRRAAPGLFLAMQCRSVHLKKPCVRAPPNDPRRSRGQRCGAEPAAARGRPFPDHHRPGEPGGGEERTARDGCRRARAHDRWAAAVRGFAGWMGEPRSAHANGGQELLAMSFS